MTELLEKAFEKASALSDSEQDLFAAWILEELEDELRWNLAFAKSQAVLARLAEEALAEFEAGHTEPLDLDTL